MTWELSFQVNHKPIPQPRHRAGKIRHGRKSGRPVMYLPADHAVHPFKGLVRYAAQQNIMNGWTGTEQSRSEVWPTTAPIDLAIYFYLQPSRGKSWPTGKPDLDNLEKSLMDALTGIVWVDDAQVVKKRTAKKFCAPSVPRCVVCISRILTE